MTQDEIKSGLLDALIIVVVLGIIITNIAAWCGHPLAQPQIGQHLSHNWEASK